MNSNLPTSYPSIVAQKDALYPLTKQLGAIREFLHNVFLSGDRTGEAATDLYYSFPDTIGSLRASHIAKVNAVYPLACIYDSETKTGFKIVTRLNELVAQRDAIKAIPVVKPVSKKSAKAAQVEAYAQDLGGNDTLRSELLKKAPVLAAAFEKHYTEQAARFLAMPASSDRRYVELRSNLRNANAIEFVSAAGIDFGRGKYIFNAAGLAAAAQVYGKETALAWYTKLALKLGSSVTVGSVSDDGHGNVQVTGTTTDGDHIHVDQQIIWKCSSRGRTFHQFPARIYVNGKFTTEAAFAKKFHAANK